LLSTIAITGASLEKFALEVRGLQKTEIGEVEEPFAKGQKGSSAMPHKRNPIGCEQICGIAEEPFCPLANGSSTTPISVFWSPRTSSANFSSDAPVMAIVLNSSACRSR